MYIGKNNSIRIHNFLEFMQTLNLIRQNDSSCVRNKTTNFYEQNPIIIGYYKNSEFNDVLQCFYYESLSGYENLDWFLDEVGNEI